MKLPFYKQQTDWTCGPAVIKMVLESLKIKKSEKSLLKTEKVSFLLKLLYNKAMNKKRKAAIKKHRKKQGKNISVRTR